MSWEYQQNFDLNFKRALGDITIEEGYYLLESFCQNVEVVSWYLYFTLLTKNALPNFKYKCHIMESHFVIWKLVLQLYLNTIYGQWIAQFIYDALLCWTVNNAMFLFFKVYVVQWLTQAIFYSVLDSEYCHISFKTWIYLVNKCFFILWWSV